ncbi:hypothetical protein C7974DRAFT_21669 [Boeremia exigua]|uniref:uncharacterized protein n=1 Tax=Boeremia exigua TaxID=749465 RepID=UPI001E8E0DC9|nr:uncharacterized protein C7974DRAFT_21669 [Boeremia exigua]KAH6644475.1 hypothetical protein C7974DRAFT_21669 [Boeremia exigua]
MDPTEGLRNQIEQLEGRIEAGTAAFFDLKAQNDELRRRLSLYECGDNSNTGGTTLQFNSCTFVGVRSPFDPDPRTLRPPSLAPALHLDQAEDAPSSLVITNLVHRSRSTNKSLRTKHVKEGVNKAGRSTKRSQNTKPVECTGDDLDIRPPLYRQWCSRAQSHEWCDRVRCRFLHEDQVKRFEALIPTLFFDPAEARAASS